MQRYEETKIISNAKKIDTNGNETTVRRLSTTIYPDFLRNGTGTRIISQDGDRLDNLAKEFYGDERLWFVIARANDIGKGSMAVPKGEVIVIPYETINGVSSLIEDYNRRR